MGCIGYVSFLDQLYYKCHGWTLHWWNLQAKNDWHMTFARLVSPMCISIELVVLLDDIFPHPERTDHFSMTQHVICLPSTDSREIGIPTWMYQLSTACFCWEVSWYIWCPLEPEISGCHGSWGSSWKILSWITLKQLGKPNLFQGFQSPGSIYFHERDPYKSSTCHCYW